MLQLNSHLLFIAGFYESEISYFHHLLLHIYAVFVCLETEWTRTSHALVSQSKRIKIKEQFMCMNPFH